jgi:hypothetical protein
MHNATTGLTGEQLAAIGSIAVESAHLEQTIDAVLWFLTKLRPEQLALLLPGVMLTTRLEMMRELAGC